MLLLGVFVFCAQLLAQNRTVTGTVTDDKGQPLANASVTVKGSNTGTITDENGKFTLNVSENARTLVVSSVGFASSEAALGNKSSFTLTLRSEDQNMSEVVVVAYGTAKKSTYVGATNQVEAKQIEQRPITNVNQALVGAAPGLQFSSGSGQPGSGPAIRIRGIGSINASSDPLYVLDGVPYSGNIENINPDDVENISILKDASATALYGAKAANGVVMITTKRGRKNRNQMNVNITQGMVSRGVQEYERVDAFQYYPLMWESYRNSLVYPSTGTGLALDVASGLASGTYPRNSAGLQVYNGKTYPDISQNLFYNPFNVNSKEIVRPDGTINPNAQLLYGDDLDWTKEIQRTGSRSDYSVSFSGGGEKNDYYASLGYVDEKGFAIKSDLKRYNGRLNFNMQPLKWLQAGMNLSGTFLQSNFADVASNTGYVNQFYFARNMGPIYPVYAHNPTTGEYLYDALGNKIFDLGGMTSLGLTQRGAGASSGRHIVAETLWDDNLYKRDMLGARTYAEVSFLRDFKFRVNAAVDRRNYLESIYDNKIVGDGAPAGRANKTNTITTELTLNQLLNYNKTLGDHTVEVLLGHENVQWDQNYLYGSVSNQVVAGNTELVNFTSANDLPYSEFNDYRTEGYFSRVNYNYNNKYFLSGSYRKDGSSKFYKDNRWGDFWSVGAGWRLDQEEFMNSVPWINQLKLRSSYGTVGNDGLTGYYKWQALYTLGFNNATEPGFVQSTLSAKDLKWEVNKQFDAGLDFGLFKNRLTGSFEYFHRATDGLLFDVPLPLSSGVLTFPMNVGAMYNEGYELQLAGDVVKTSDFKWNLNVNATTFKNEITKLPPGQDRIISGTKQLEVGHSVYDYWLRDWYGVDPDDGSALYRANTWNPANSRVTKGGDTVTTVISNAKYHYEGTAIPDVFGGVTSTFSYKNFDLGVQFTYQIGGLTYDDSYAGLMTPDYGSAVHVDVLKRWQKPGDVTDVPRMDYGRRTDFGGSSDRWLIDASHLNLRSINLGYNLSPAMASRIKVQNARFFLSGENLYMFSKRQGMNPLQAFTGISNNGYVPARTLSAGLNITL